MEENFCFCCTKMNALTCQGSKGIRQRSLNWFLSSMIIAKITPSISRWNVWTDTHLNKPTNQNSQKLFSKQIRNCYHKTLGTSVINSPLSPPSLIICGRDCTPSHHPWGSKMRKNKPGRKGNLIKLLPKVYFSMLQKNFGYFYRIMIDWFQTGNA